MAQSEAVLETQEVATGFQIADKNQGNQRSDPCEPAHEEGGVGRAWAADCWIQRNVSRDSVFQILQTTTSAEKSDS